MQSIESVVNGGFEGWNSCVNRQVVGVFLGI